MTLARPAPVVVCGLPPAGTGAGMPTGISDACRTALMPALAFELRLVSMRFVGRADGGGGGAAMCCSQGKDMAQDLGP